MTGVQTCALPISCVTSNVSSNSTAGSSNTNGFAVYSNSASNTTSGTMIIANVSGNIWVENHTMYQAGSNYTVYGGGVITLAGALNYLRLISSATGSPSDTFDGGSINILYE